MKPPESCVELLSAMVGFDTVNHHISQRPGVERGLAAWLEEVSQAWGLQTKRLIIDQDSFNLIVWHEVAPAAPWLLFESHLDTVSTEGMTVDPLAGAITDGRLYGRGACDTKGTGAAMLWALRQYAVAPDGTPDRTPDGTPDGTNVALLFSTDEEIGKTGVRTFTETQLQDLGWRPEGVVIGEPTLLRPIIAHNGVARWTIRTRGVSAHSSDPSRGRSAISMMARVIDVIEQRYIPSLTASHELTGKAQCSINVIRGGVQINVVPESCEIEIDRRVVPGEDGATVLPAVARLLAELCREHPDIAVEQLEPFLDPPLDPVGGEAFAQNVSNVLQSLGLCGEPTGARYGTDASQFSALGIPAVVLGPGSIDQAHTKDEWLALDQLAAGVEVYGALMAASWRQDIEPD